MNWDNKETSKSLVKLAELRLDNIKNIKNATLKVESYYEIIKELITALLILHGYKSYSHECLISFVKEMYKNKFTGMQIELIDHLRILRNDIAYRGAFIDVDFLERNEDDIITIINRLKELIMIIENESGRNSQIKNKEGIEI